MRRIRVSLGHDAWSILFRQTPRWDGVWGDCVFLRPDAPGADEPDYWVVFDSLAETEEARVATGRVIFVTGEPESIRFYEPEFLAQFGLVATSQPRIAGANVVHTQPATPWHIGWRRGSHGADQLDEDVPVLGYDDFARASFDKVSELSVVCTTRSETPGHRVRLALVERLAEHFGDRLDWFGRGVRPIEDKWDAIAPYRFHVCLENCVERDYWTEKVADAYLGGAFPFYWGCPNFADYYEPDAYRWIDARDPSQAIEVIERTLEEGITAARAAALARARDRVLNEFNFFPNVVSLLDACADGPVRPVEIRPSWAFHRRPPLWRRTAGRMKRAALRRRTKTA